MHATAEFHIEAILAHAGSADDRKHMSFLVRWVGYYPGQDSWGPYGNLRDTVLLNQYMYHNKLRKLLPRGYVAHP